MALDSAPFLSIEKATVKHLGKVMFQELDFKMLSGENWAIIGGSGAEKTAFLDTLHGKTTVVDGRIIRSFVAAYEFKEGQITSFRDLVAMVSQRYEFRNKAHMQDFYYQQRFNASESEEAPTVEEYLQQIEVKASGQWELHNVLELLHLDTLKDKSLIKLSNGETRRLAIAGALIKNPRLLLIDQPMAGLDAGTRMEFGNMVKVITDSGIQLVMTATPNEIPDAITHVGILEKGHLVQVVKRKDFHPLNKGHFMADANNFNRLIELVQRKKLPVYEALITMKDVHIQYGDKVILDQVNWKVQQGEYWALKGHNGAGKSTLLSLAFGENPQAYANDILLFDRKRGTGESIWDIKRPTGFVSSEMQRYFPKNQTCLQIVISGLFDTIGLFKKPNAAQEALAYEWMEALGIQDIAALRLSQLSLEKQRFCLLARSMIKSPALLILDEAAQGMDEEQRTLFRETIEVICRNSRVSLIYVSHYEADIPACINRRIVLKAGKIVEMI